MHSQTNKNSSLIDNEQPKIRAAEFNWDRYRTLDEVHEWLDEIVEEHKDVATPITIGRSYEGRPIKGVLISFKRVRITIFVNT